MITPDYLSQLQALCDAATPTNEWDENVDEFDPGHGPTYIYASGPYHITEDGSEAAGDKAQRDAEFIAAARTAVPLLIQEVRRLRDEMQGTAEALQNHALRCEDEVFNLDDAAECMRHMAEILLKAQK